MMELVILVIDYYVLSFFFLLFLCLIHFVIGIIRWKKSKRSMLSKLIRFCLWGTLYGFVLWFLAAYGLYVSLNP